MSHWHALADVRSKTGRIATVDSIGPLQDVLRRVLALSFPVQSMRLVVDEQGRPMTLPALRRRFWAAREMAGAKWQLRDIRAKAASDSDDLKSAQGLLAHGGRRIARGERGADEVPGHRRPVDVVVGTHIGPGTVRP